MISPRFRKLAPMTSVLCPYSCNRRKCAERKGRPDRRRADNPRVPVDFCTNPGFGPQRERSVGRPLPHRRRPAETRRGSVRLQWMPDRVSCSAARMPSQVEANLIKMRSRKYRRAHRVRLTIWLWQWNRRLSKLRRASTSVETRCETILRISRPKATANLSIARARR